MISLPLMYISCFCKAFWIWKQHAHTCINFDKNISLNNSTLFGTYYIAQSSEQIGSIWIWNLLRWQKMNYKYYPLFYTIKYKNFNWQGLKELILWGYYLNSLLHWTQKWTLFKPIFINKLNINPVSEVVMIWIRFLEIFIIVWLHICEKNKLSDLPAYFRLGCVLVAVVKIMTMLLHH